MSLCANMRDKKRRTRSTLCIITKGLENEQPKRDVADFIVKNRVFKPTQKKVPNIVLHQETLEHTLWDCFYRNACPCKLADFVYEATNTPDEMYHPMDSSIRLDSEDVSLHLRNVIRHCECVALLRTILGDNEKLQWLKQYIREVDSGVSSRVLNEHITKHLTKEDTGLRINVCTRCHWLFAHLSANQPFVMYTHVIVLLRCIEEQYPMVGIRIT